MNISTSGIKKAYDLPDGFVYIDDIIEDCIIDAKLAGTDNITGHPLDGYEKPLVVMSVEAAEACAKAADILRSKGYIMKIFDSYRPQRAVDDLCRWGEDLEDQRRKPIQYPKIDKAKMFEEEYICRKSSHTRGGAIDLTIVNMETHQEVDMGTCFDYMDTRSWPESTEISEQQHNNRWILREAMLSCGFVPFPNEWWHFSIDPEPYPDTYFDFPVR